MEQQRIFSASDLAQFEYCPLAWWYEEVSDLAQADPAELAERLEELEDQYPASASAQPEYQVIERLLARANQFALGRARQTADAAAHHLSQSDVATITTPVPRAFAALVVGLVALTIVLIGLGLLLWLR
ncbi:MAG TPA: hypothetical protein VKT82_19860 [Ktedonobacterales bacterium]|nr:hypothetical protein [Ktedonobacterales bacterium]